MCDFKRLNSQVLNKIGRFLKWREIWQNVEPESEILMKLDCTQACNHGKGRDSPDCHRSIPFDPSKSYLLAVLAFLGRVGCIGCICYIG